MMSNDYGKQLGSSWRAQNSTLRGIKTVQLHVQGVGRMILRWSIVNFLHL